MGNQAQQRQELELWQVVSPPKNNKNKSSRTSRPRNRDMHSEEIQTIQVSRTRRAAGHTASGDSIKVLYPNAAGTRPSAPRRQASRAVRPNAARTARPDMPRTSAARSSRQQTYRIDARPATAGQTAARQVRSEYIAFDRERTSPSRIVARPAAERGRRARISQCLAILWIAAMSTAIFFMGKAFFQSTKKPPITKEEITAKSLFDALPVMEDTKRKPEMLEDFLTISEYNRPGTKLERVNNIFVHYTANPGTSAAQNRSYFESLGQTHERAASAHFIIGYDGEIIQCIPLEEEAYAVRERNADSISIECCYIAEDGSFTQATYDSLIEMLAWLTDEYHLEPQDILRHYDCGGKKCPLYYVEHEDAWQQLLDDVRHYIP